MKKSKKKKVLVEEINFDKFSIIKSFESLELGETVYSRKYGLGTIIRFHNDEVIVRFKNLRKRFSLEDQELRQIPPRLLEKNKIKVAMTVDGERMSYSAFKKKISTEKREKKERIKECVSIEVASNILGIKKEKLLKNIKEMGIRLEVFGAKKMIHRRAILFLSKVRVDRSCV